MHSLSWGETEGAGKKGSWLSYMETVSSTIAVLPGPSTVPAPGRHSLEGVGREGQGEGRSSVGRWGDVCTLVRHGVCPGQCVHALSSPTLWEPCVSLGALRAGMQMQRRAARTGDWVTLGLTVSGVTCVCRGGRESGYLEKPKGCP